MKLDFNRLPCTFHLRLVLLDVRGQTKTCKANVYAMETNKQDRMQERLRFSGFFFYERPNFNFLNLFFLPEFLCNERAESHKLSCCV